MWGYLIAVIAACFVIETLGKTIVQFWPWVIAVTALCLLLSLIVKVIRHDKVQKIVVLAASLVVIALFIAMLPLRLESYFCVTLVALAFYASGAIVCKNEWMRTSGKFVCAMMPAAVMVTIAVYEPDFMSIIAAAIGIIASIWIASDV
jgi:hypothetical protein